MIGCVPHYLDLVKSCVGHFPKNFHPKTVLDLGCGNGNLTTLLIKNFPKATFTMVDASAEMIELCRKQYENYHVKYVNSYFKDFPFEKDSYDLVVAGFSLHHCDADEKQSLFNKIYNALKIGGIFSSCDLMINKSHPDHPALVKQWKEFVNNNFSNEAKWNWLMEHYKAFDKPDNYFDQIKWLKNAGFTKIIHPFKKGYWVHLQAVKE